MSPQDAFYRSPSTVNDTHNTNQTIPSYYSNNNNDNDKNYNNFMCV